MAIRNSKDLGLFDKREPIKAICEMHLLFLADELKKYYE